LGECKTNRPTVESSLGERDVLERPVGGDEMIATSKTQLLATKILPPQCAPGLIDRPRLLDLIAQVQAKQVAVIQAGPGFGKTSLAVALGGATSEER
jgi:hypothetical protein